MLIVYLYNLKKMKKIKKNLTGEGEGQGRGRIESTGQFLIK